MATVFDTFVNNSNATIATGNNYVAGAGSIVLTSGEGAQFGSNFPIKVTVITAASYRTSSEVLTIFTVTGRSTDTLTGVTSAEGTTDQNFAAGSMVEERFTAGEANLISTAINAIENAPYLTPTSSGASLTGITGSQITGNISGDAASITGSITESQVTGLSTSLAALAPLDSPALTGTPTAPTASGGTNTTQVATTAFVQAALPSIPVTSVFARTGAVLAGSGDYTVSQVTGAAPLASPSFTGTVTLPTGLTGVLKAASGVVSTATAGVDFPSFLADAGVKTGNYTATADQIVRCDTTSGSFTVTLPTAPPDKTQMYIKMVTLGSTNTVTVATGGSDVYNKTGGGTTLTLSLLAQGVLLQYVASPAVWVVMGDDLPLSQLNAVFSPIAGSTSIVSVGTLASGTWQGSLVSATYGGTGVNNGSSTITIGGNIAFSGAYTFTGTLTANTSVTFPTSGTLVNSAVSSLSSLSITTSQISDLSSWAGSTSVTTLGTVGTGTWQGTAVGIGYGGTGQATAGTAFNALSPMTAAGDLIYGGTSGAGTRLAIGSANQVLTVNSGANGFTYSTPTTGTVTSVTFTGDGTVLSSTPSSAVTGSGTVAASMATQSANLILSGPTTGSAATPTFRSLVAADLASGIVSYSKIQNESAVTVLGNPTGSGAAPSEISMGQNMGLIEVGSTYYLKSGVPVAIITGAGTPIANSTSQTSVFTGSTMSGLWVSGTTITIPANTLQVGSRITFKLFGTWSASTTSTPTVKVVYMMGGSSIGSYTSGATGNQTTQPWHTLNQSTPEIVVLSTGSGGTVMGMLGITLGGLIATGFGTGQTGNTTAPAAVTVATNGTLTLDLQMKWSVQSASNTIQLLGGVVYCDY